MGENFLYITLSSFSNAKEALTEFPYESGQKITEESAKGGNPFITIDLATHSMTDEQRQFLSDNPKVLFFNTSGLAWG